MQGQPKQGSVERLNELSVPVLTSDMVSKVLAQQSLSAV